MSKLKIGKKVRYDGVLYEINAFLTDENKLSVDETDWVLISTLHNAFTKDARHYQITTHVGLVEPELT